MAPKSGVTQDTFMLLMTTGQTENITNNSGSTHSRNATFGGLSPDYVGSRVVVMVATTPPWGTWHIASSVQHRYVY
jgi:hypothetical protein